MTAPQVQQEDSYDMHVLTKKYRPAVPDDPTRKTRTRTVILRDTGGEAVINVSDFDPLVHEMPGDQKGGVGKASTEKLAALTLAELGALAKGAGVILGAPGESVKKADVVAKLAAAGVTP